MNQIPKLFLLLSFVASISFAANAQKTSTVSEASDFRVEPPSWWVGMQNPSLQLLVYGKDISKTTLMLDYPGVILKKKTSVENPNYLFLDLEIAPETEAGSFNLIFKDGNKTVFDYKYFLNERNKVPLPAKDLVRKM